MDSVISKFRKSRGQWFRCPCCGGAGWKSSTRAEYRLRPVLRFRVVYRCNICDGLSTLKGWQRPAFWFIKGVACFVALFFAHYYFLSNFQHATAFAFVVILDAIILIAIAVVGQFANHYSPVDGP